MTVSINGTNGLVFNDNSTQNTAAKTGMVNRIINGDMKIDQRNAGASVTPTNGSYALDRWKFFVTQASKLTCQQNAGSVTPPVGFGNYLGVTSSSAYSVGSTDYFCLNQPIEGFNTSDLAWGTASAAPVTLSFLVRSSLTGTFGGALNNGAFNRSYPFSYTIASANTWTPISVTIAGDTTGTWVGATNGIGLNVTFGLGSGSTNSGTSGSWASGFLVQPTSTVSVVGTNGATFYITGVQLEKGSTATPFEYRPYKTEESLCRNYYRRRWAGSAYDCVAVGYCNGATSGQFFYPFDQPMRTTPTFNWSGSGWQFSTGAAAGSIIAMSLATLQSSSNGAMVNITSSGLTNLALYRLEGANASNNWIDFSAEL
jgi:hypothetical protein